MKVIARILKNADWIARLKLPETVLLDFIKKNRGRNYHSRL